MKILMLIPRDGLSGGIYVSYIQAQALYEAGVNIRLCFVHEKHIPGTLSFPNIQVPKTLYAHELQKQDHYDMVIATWWETFYDAMRINADRIVYFCQSDERRFYPEGDPRRAQVHFTYIHRDVSIITEAKWIRAMFQHEFGMEAYYTPNGIDLVRFNPNVKPVSPRSERPRILIEGPGDIPFKRVALAFEVTNAFADEYEVWYVSSTKYINPTWKFARRFVKVPYSEMPRIYASCDILVKLSAVEGFFGPPLEMMACGGTAVVSKVTGYDEYIRDGYNAFAVPIDDITAARNRLERLLQDAELRKTFCQNGIRTAQSLDWHRQVPKFYRALQKIHRDRPHTRQQTRDFVLSMAKAFPEEHFSTTEIRLIRVGRKLKRLPGLRLALKPIKHFLQKFAANAANTKPQPSHAAKTVSSESPRKLLKRIFLSELKITFIRYLLRRAAQQLDNIPTDAIARIPCEAELPIVFVGQPEYFSKVYMDAIVDGYGHEFPIDSLDQRKLSSLPEFVHAHGCKTVIVFRPEFFHSHAHILQYLKDIGVTLIGYSTEPIPHDRQIGWHRDQILRLKNLLQARHLPYDHIVHMDGSSYGTLSFFGFNRLSCFPLPTSKHMYHSLPDTKKKYDVLFLGRSTEYREWMMSRIKQKLDVLHITHGMFYESNRLMNESRIVLNLHNEPYPNFENRAFQALFSGAILVSDKLSGPYLQANKHYHCVSNPDELLNICEDILVGTAKPLEPAPLEQYTMEAFLAHLGIVVPRRKSALKQLHPRKRVFQAG